jgi:hypothetical protein
VNFRARSGCAPPLLTRLTPSRKSRLIPADSHTSAHSRAHPLFFHIHPQNARGVGSPSPSCRRAIAAICNSLHSLFSVASALFHSSYMTLLLATLRLAHSCPKNAGGTPASIQSAPCSPRLRRRSHIIFSSLVTIYEPATIRQSRITSHDSRVVLPSWQDGNACTKTMLRGILRGAYTGPDEFVSG